MNNENLPAIGRRVKKRRKDLDLTLFDLASRTELTASYISKIERGSTSPSLKTLIRLSEALDVQILYLMAEEMRPHSYLRAESRQRITLPEVEASYELLTPNLSGAFETLLIHLEPHSMNAVRKLRTDTEELFYVIRGSLLVEIDSEEIILNPGDSLQVSNRFNLTKILCVGDEPVTYLVVVSPPAL